MWRLLQHPVALVFLCISLIGTPVTYRGGASNPHAHMFLEFLMDAETGAFDHHHHGDAGDAGDAGGMEHPDRGHNRAPAPAGPRVVDPADRFGPSLTSFVVGDVGQVAFILPQSMLPEVGDLATALFPLERYPTGISLPPPAPPPR